MAESSSTSRLSLVTRHEASTISHMTDLSRWSIFSILEPDVLTSIKKVCVFGSSGNEAIFLTDDDDVYAIGSNCSSCLGLGDTHSSFTPRKIEGLCKKKLLTLPLGVVLMFLQSLKMEMCTAGDIMAIVSWVTEALIKGSNLPLSTQIFREKVFHVACGSHHSMALTSEGEIYAWGQNNCGQVGTGTTTNQPTPRKITAVIGCRTVVAISCGQTSSMALMDNVVWLGLQRKWSAGAGQQCESTQSMQGGRCPLWSHHQPGGVGYAHTMALSDEGVLYSWGANSYGQLGTSSKANQVYPTKVERTERFVEIAASHYTHISAAMSQTGKVYMWGQCRGQSVTSPMLTRFNCVDDVFATFSAPPISWRTYSVEHVRGSRIAQNICKAFDDPVTADLKFVVEDREIHVHKSILKIRCEYFRSMFQSCWEEDGKDTIEITQYPYSVYRAFLQYLYTDQVDLVPEEAIGLLDLANAYCEPILKNYCEQIIKQGITVKDVAMLYAAAIKFEAKVLEEFCFRFALNHMTAVTQTEAFTKLDECVVKEFIRKAALAGGFQVLS